MRTPPAPRRNTHRIAGNIMVTNKGEVALVDFGQTKQISPEMRLALAKVMVMLANCGSVGCTFQARPRTVGGSAAGLRRRGGGCLAAGLW